jgi:hypothetical protein
VSRDAANECPAADKCVRLSFLALILEPGVKPLRSVELVVVALDPIGLSRAANTYDESNDARRDDQEPPSHENGIDPTLASRIHRENDRAMSNAARGTDLV